MANRKLTGRPGRPAGELTWMLSTRISPEVRDRLRAAAESSGRSLAQEVEHRLRWTLEPERNLGPETVLEALAAVVGSQEGARLLLVLGRVMELVEGTVGDWRTSAVAFDRMREGIDVVLDQMRPEELDGEADELELGVGRWAAKVALAEFSGKMYK